MKTTYKRGFLTLLLSVGITSAALAFINSMDQSAAKAQTTQTTSEKAVSVESQLTQTKVLQGSDGKVGMSITLTGANIQTEQIEEIQPVDITLVLDRSGSMGGQKINDARQAVLQLMGQLNPQDRLALVTYANDVRTLSPLLHMNGNNKEKLASLVHSINSGGGTNLGGGLQQGIDAFQQSFDGNRQRKVILISDGLANQGITHPARLGSMAANGSENNLTVSTIGVGYDYNEQLMTSIADHGGGNYHFLENPQVFTSIFTKEFESSRNVIASQIEIRIPLDKNVKLVGAGGYPITMLNNVAVIRPGELLAGQQRKLFLTYQLPTSTKQSYRLGNVSLNYNQRGFNQSLSHTQEFQVKCVEDKGEVIASIDKNSWSEQVVKEEYNSLKDKVASAIRNGKKAEAMQTIQEYEARNQAINDRVGSASVAKNLDEEVQQLRKNVEDTFTGAPTAVEQKKKQQAKVLQYESYKVRRDKK